MRKSFPAEVKALNDDEGLVEAIVSVFGNVDHAGDRVMKGAFRKSIDRWREAGDPIPVVFSHDWGDLWSHIGYADPNDLEETEVGLKARYRLDIEDNPAARQAFKLMKRRTLKEHSFAYEVKAEKPGEDGANELLDLDLIEIGPTLKGMNPSTELLAVKSALEEQAKAKAEQDETTLHVSVDSKAVADAISEARQTFTKAQRDKIQAAIESLQDVLTATGEDEEKAGDEAEANGKASDDALLSLRTRIEQLRGE